MNWLTGHRQSRNLQPLCIPLSVFIKGRVSFWLKLMFTAEIRDEESPNYIFQTWRVGSSIPEPWIRCFWRSGWAGVPHGTSQWWVRTLPKLQTIQHEDSQRQILNPFIFPCRAINRRSKDECHPSGLIHAYMGCSGAEVPSAIAAADGGMCCSHHSRAAA